MSEAGRRVRVCDYDRVYGFREESPDLSRGQDAGRLFLGVPILWGEQRTGTKKSLKYSGHRLDFRQSNAEHELIGMPHAFLQYSDVDEEVFQELWKTIQAKQIWQGLLKNRKKDGTLYIEEMTITPQVSIIA